MPQDRATQLHKGSRNYVKFICLPWSSDIFKIFLQKSEAVIEVGNNVSDLCSPVSVSFKLVLSQTICLELKVI